MYCNVYSSRYSIYLIFIIASNIRPIILLTHLKKNKIREGFKKPYLLRIGLQMRGRVNPPSTNNITNRGFLVLILYSSVADPDPVEYGLFGVNRIRIRENTGSGSFIYKNTPVIYISRYIKLSKIQFCQNNFLSWILSVIRCLDLV